MASPFPFTRLAGALLSAVLALASLVSFVGAATADPAGSPLKLYQGLSSSFGEYRASHLHAGVDLSTGGRNGYRVYAVADGEIVRLAHTWRGYGKALTVRHVDGSTALYGHLQSFAPGTGLEELARRRAGADGYAGVVELDRPVAVKRGQVIALSGETGEGLPHLHLEFRDPAGNPVAPSTLGLHFPDTEPPVVETLFVDPAEAGAAVDGSPLRRLVSLAAASPEPSIVVRGTLRLGVRAHDRAGAEARLGLHRLEASLDGVTIFRLLLERFPVKERLQVASVYDPLESHLGPTVYAYRLEPRPARRLGIAEWRPPLGENGLDTGLLTPGPHRLEIVAADAAGNETRRRVTLVVDRPAKLELLSCKESASGLTVDVRRTDPDGETSASGVRAIFSPDGGVSWREVSAAVERAAEPGRLSVTLRRPETPPLQITLPEPGQPGLLALEADGPEPSALLFLPPPGHRPSAGGPGGVSFQHRGSFVRLNVNWPLSGGETGEVLLAGPGGERLSLPVFCDRHGCAALWTIPAGTRGTWQASLPGGPSTAVELFSLPGGPAARLSWEEMTLDFPENALTGETVLRRDRSEARPDSALPFQSAPWRLESTAVPFDRPVLLTLRHAESKRPWRLGICRHDPFRDSWVFLERATAPEGWIGAEVRLPGSYAVLEDTVPPVIEGLLAPAGGTGSSEIVLKVSERGMGIDHRRLEVSVDGKPLKAEYDPDRGTVVAPLSAGMAVGRHRLAVTLRDRAGNVSPRWETEFGKP